MLQHWASGIAGRPRRRPFAVPPGYPPVQRMALSGRFGELGVQALNELPQPQVEVTLGLSNLKPAPSIVST